MNGLFSMNEGLMRWHRPAKGGPSVSIGIAARALTIGLAEKTYARTESALPSKHLELWM